MSVREVNLNFDAKQAVVYAEDGTAVRIVGADFAPFEPILDTVSSIVTNQIIADKKAERIVEIDKQMSDLAKRKGRLENGLSEVKEKVSPIGPPTRIL